MPMPLHTIQISLRLCKNRDVNTERCSIYALISLIKALVIITGYVLYIVEKQAAEEPLSLFF